MRRSQDSHGVDNTNGGGDVGGKQLIIQVSAVNLLDLDPFDGDRKPQREEQIFALSKSSSQDESADAKTLSRPTHPSLGRSTNLDLETHLRVLCSPLPLLSA